MKSDIVAVVLSGGKSSRMNYENKSFLKLEGKTFIKRILENLEGFKEVCISCNDFSLYKEFENQYKLIADIKRNIGPIGGIYSTFKETGAKKLFVVATDMPFISKDIVDSICSIDFEGDALVVCSKGRVEPLFAVYKDSILLKLEECINDKVYKMMVLLNRIKTSYFYIENNHYFKNINRKEDYLEISENLDLKIGTRVINIVGSGSNTGKTTLIEGIIKELKNKGYTVSTIKHDVHGFDIDKEGKDTYRHRMAGADNISISSKNRFALIREVEKEITIEEIIEFIPKTDFIIVEGYKNSNLRKIEVFREGFSKEIITSKDKLIAIASDDIKLKCENVSIIEINDYESIVKLIEKEAKYKCIH